MKQRMSTMSLLRLSLLAVALSATLWSQDVAVSADETSKQIVALRQQIETIQVSQKEMRQMLRAVEDILLGKRPVLENVFIRIEGSPTLGETSARLILVEVSDFQCPYCGSYARQTFDPLITEYVKTGRLRYVTRSCPLEDIHPLAETAAEAALCAGDQGHYWEIYARLFRNQQDLDVSKLHSYAVALGLDAPSFDRCLAENKYASTVAKDLKEGQNNNVNGTPTFFLGFVDPDNPSRMKAVKSLTGSLPFREVQGEIDRLLKSDTELGR